MDDVLHRICRPLRSVSNAVKWWGKITPLMQWPYQHWNVCLSKRLVQYKHRRLNMNETGRRWRRSESTDRVIQFSAAIRSHSTTSRLNAGTLRAPTCAYWRTRAHTWERQFWTDHRDDVWHWSCDSVVLAAHSQLRTVADMIKMQEVRFLSYGIL